MGEKILEPLPEKLRQAADQYPVEDLCPGCGIPFCPTEAMGLEHTDYPDHHCPCWEQRCPDCPPMTALMRLVCHTHTAYREAIWANVNEQAERGIDWAQRRLDIIEARKKSDIYDCRAEAYNDSATGGIEQ